MQTLWVIRPNLHAGHHYLGQHKIFPFLTQRFTEYPSKWKQWGWRQLERRASSPAPSDRRHRALHDLRPIVDPATSAVLPHCSKYALNSILSIFVEHFQVRSQPEECCPYVEGTSIINTHIPVFFAKQTVRNKSSSSVQMPCELIAVRRRIGVVVVLFKQD